MRVRIRRLGELSSRGLEVPVLVRRQGFAALQVSVAPSDAVGLKSGSCPLARILAPRLAQTVLHGDALALRSPSPPSGWDGNFTRLLSNMRGVQQEGAERQRRPAPSCNPRLVPART
jgi:hypothetical protein